MTHLVDTLSEHLRELDWIYQVEDEGQSLKVIVPCSSITLPSIVWALSDETCVLRCYYPITITGDQRSNILELLHRLNQKAPQGKYIYEFDSDVISFELILGKDVLENVDAEIVQFLFITTGWNIERAVPAIQQVATGKSNPERAIADLEKAEAESSNEQTREAQARNRLEEFMVDNPENN